MVFGFKWIQLRRLLNMRGELFQSGQGSYVCHGRKQVLPWAQKPSPDICNAFSMVLNTRHNREGDQTCSHRRAVLIMATSDNSCKDGQHHEFEYVFCRAHKKKYEKKIGRKCSRLSAFAIHYGSGSRPLSSLPKAQGLGSSSRQALLPPP